MPAGAPFDESKLAEIRAHLDSLLASTAFAGSTRRGQLLRYLSDRALSGRPSEISEYGIGLDVFSKPPSFDPRIDSTIRSEISRLRQKLRDYYSTDGRESRVMVELPSRSYVPEFTFNARETPRAPKWPSHGTLLAAIGIVAVVLGGFAFWRMRARSRPAIESLVVLPFANMSSDPRNEYLADGLTEELTNDLAQWPDLRVVARTSAFEFKGKGVDVREVGRKLNVEAVLEGSIDQQGDRIRVTAQLNRASNGFHLWSKSFESQSSDMMLLKEQMARSIADAVRGAGRSPSPPAPVRSTNSAEALDLYLQGNYQISLHTPESYQKADDLCHTAASKDPSYVSAYLCIANAENSLIHLTVEPPDEGFERIRKALNSALAIDPNSAEAHGFMGNIAYIHDWDWPRAEREYRFAVEHGNQARAHSQYGWALATRGRFREAQQQFRISDDLDPLGSRFNEMLAFMLERKFPEANLVLRRMLEEHPDQLAAHSFLGLIAMYRHDCKTASSEFEWCARQSQIPFTKILLAFGCACRGEQDQARANLQQVESVAAFVSPYQLAMGYAFVHDAPRAISYLEKSAADHEGQVLYIRYDPVFDEIRADPAFVALEKKLGLL
jgi:TolB-like protein